MPDDEVRIYLGSLRDLTAARGRAEQVVVPIVAAGEALREWWRVGFANLPNAASPTGVVGRRIDAKTWKSADEVNTALRTWQEAHWAAEKAWDALRGDDRVGLQPPESAMPGPRLRSGVISAF